MTSKKSVKKKKTVIFLHLRYNFAMPFLLKSIISHFLHPMPILITLLAAWGILSLWPKTRKIAKGFLVCGILFFLATFFGVFNPVLERLERECPPFPGDDTALCEELRGAVVTVLGQGFSTVDLPPRFRDNYCLRQRISEGAYVAHKIPDSTLLLSMSGEAPYEQKELGVLEFAATYGLPTNRVAFYAEARDTREEAADTLRLAGTNKIVVVTSASHMPRAMIIFRRAGCDPVPAPCDYCFFGENARWTWKDWHFGIRNLERLDRLMHEEFGLLYERLK